MRNGMTQAERAKQILADLDHKEAERKKKLAEKRATVARRVTALIFKEEIHEMTLIGKYMLADRGKRAVIEHGLQEAEIAEHDAQFLKSRGWAL